ncbi:SH3 domain-containing protein [Streptomyces sp. NPDC004031]
MTVFGAAAVPVSAATGQPRAVSRCGYEVTVDALRLRGGPGTQYGVVALMSKDSLVDADRDQGGWYRVTVLERWGSAGAQPGAKGWAAASYLQVVPCTHLD